MKQLCVVNEALNSCIALCCAGKIKKRNRGNDNKNCDTEEKFADESVKVQTKSSRESAKS